MPFVLDNSVTCGWFLDNQASDYTEAIARRLEVDQAVVPVLWELELTNVLRTACLKRQLSAQAAQEVLDRIGSLPIGVDRQSVRPGEILALALRFGLSSYDAAYLELALRLQIPVATVDGPLRDAAQASGAGVVAGD
ncbi:MAG: type II toxin-antitoxin system VapC family toxin [Burkholderiaceae bacterium]